MKIYYKLSLECLIYIVVVLLNCKVNLFLEDIRV